MVQVTKHAELRYQQRVDEAEPYPKQQLRELYENAEIDSSVSISEGTLYVADEAVLVIKDESHPVIATVLRRGPV